MKSALPLCFLLLSVNLIIIFGYDELSNYEGGRWYREQPYLSPSKEPSLSCNTEKECLCRRESETNVFNCENEFHARLGIEMGDFEIRCNVTLKSENFGRDYYSILEMKKVLELNIHLINCPEPPASYPLLFAVSSHHDDGAARIPDIHNLKIDCGLRKKFVIEKKHFEGMSELISLNIICSALVNIPADLFSAKFPNLIDLKISNTKIKNIPDGLFFTLNALETLSLQSNEISQINDNDFKGLKYLEKLLIDEKHLVSFGENSFNHTKHINTFALFRSKVNRLPSSFGKLVSLESIHLTNNSIDVIEGICTAFSNLREVIITNNYLNHIDFACFHSFGKVNSIDISGNSFSILPNTPILMNELTLFTLSYNAETLTNVHRFISSEELAEIEMQFSNIESMDSDFLHSVPSLKYLRLTGNKISSLHEDFFAFNPILEKVFLNTNRISVLPEGLLRNNIDLIRIDFFSNQIREIPPSLFKNTSILRTLRFDDNLINGFSENLLSNLMDLQHVFLSNNRIRFIHNNSFVGMNSLRTLDIGNNLLNSSVANTFWPFKKLKNFLNLYLHGNSINSIPPMGELTLRFINLANNSLQKIENDTFFNLKQLRKLDLSKNSLETLPDSPLVNGFQMEILDLSLNKLQDFTANFIPKRNRIYYLDLSGNKIERFDICSLVRVNVLEQLYLSENGMYEIGDFSECYLELNNLKILNLSHNQLSFNDSLWSFDWVRKTWGRISPLLIFPNLEKISLRNNSISSVFMDWRNMFLKLKKIDLSHNKIQHLTHQDLLFTSTLIMENGSSIPYPCHHSLIVDLQFNQIKKIELPTKMLIKIPRKREIKLYGHVTINLDNNPFYCGCGIINFLRLLDGDVALTSELRRTEGKEWILSANIQVGNLSCWLPETVREKKLAEPLTWMHHIFPTLGVCSLLENE